MRKLPAAPSPKSFAELWKSEVLAPAAKRIAGADNVLTQDEVKKAIGALTGQDKLLEPSLTRLAASLGAKGSTVDAFVATESARVLELATKAAGPDGKMTAEDANASELGPAYNFLRTGKLGEPTPAGLAGQIPAAWRSELKDETDKDYFKKLDAFVTTERATHSVFPPAALTFAALAHTPPNKVRVVVIGQDPYPTQGNANGLAFSVNPGMPIPGSLKNIYKVLEKDVHTTAPTTGDLTQWADQGVLLLNTVLTVREGEPNSHHGQGWETFTEAIIKKINESDQPVVFLLLGKQAQSMAGMIDQSKHAIVTAPHPSPMNTTAFLKSRPFSAVNAALEAKGRGSIDWQIR
jgi:uracil-DNA glycosylase